MKCFSFRFLLFILLSLGSVLGADTVCEVLNLDNCDRINKMVRRSSARSVPSTTTAAQFNPANVSHDRGLGLESFYQAGNKATHGVVTGTGKVGAALISSQSESSFFGNRLPEFDNDYLKRQKSKKQFESNKYSLALGGALLKRKNLGLDLGIQAKYHQDLHRLNPGAGLGLRWGILTLGASLYQDDVKLNLGHPSHEDYSETFIVQNVFAGLKINDLYLDYGSIRTRYKLYGDEGDVSISLFSSSYIWNKFLFNLAYRIEDSPFAKSENGILIKARKKYATYTGMQFSLTPYFILGVHYNYFLLNEGSASMAIFF
jgi:hypothetical protein